MVLPKQVLFWYSKGPPKTCPPIFVLVFFSVTNQNCYQNSHCQSETKIAKTSLTGTKPTYDEIKNKNKKKEKQVSVGCKDRHYTIASVFLHFNKIELVFSYISIDRKDLKCVVVRSGPVRSVPIEFPRMWICVNPRNCTYAFPRMCISTFYACIQ